MLDNFIFCVIFEDMITNQKGTKMTLKEILQGRKYVVERGILRTRALTRANCNGEWITYDIKDTDTAEVILSAHGAAGLSQITYESNTSVYKIFVNGQELKDVEQPVQERIFVDVNNLYFEQKRKKEEEERAKIEQKKSILYQKLFNQIQKQ